MSEVNGSNLFANILSWQSQLLEPNNIQKNVNILKEMNHESLINTHRGRVVQGEIEIILYVSISFIKNISEPPPNVLEVEENKLRDMIEDEIGKIFKNRQFQSDHRMANSNLHTLKVIWKVCAGPSTRSKRDKAEILRVFLTNCLEELSPFDTPKEAATAAQIRQWTEYFILRRQYVDGKSQDEVQRDLEKKIHQRIKGGAYNRHQQAGRERLVTLICQKEIELRKEQSNEKVSHLREEDGA